MKRLGAALNGVAEPHKRESQTGKISTVGNGGKSLTVTNANNSQLRNLIPITPYGISSSPTPGLMAFVLVAQNSGKDGIVGVYDEHKPTCKSGDCMMYSKGGATVKCTGGSVLINGRNVLKEIDDIKSRL